MNKKIIQMAILIFFSVIVHAQTMKIQWSDPINTSGSIIEFSPDLINSNHVYARFSLNNANLQEIYSFDKNTFQKLGECVQMDFKDKKLKEYSIEEYVSLKNNVYLFWTKSDGGFYVQIFDTKLNPLSEKTKVQGFDNIKMIFFDWTILANSKAAEKIVICNKKSSEKGENVVIEYKVYDNTCSLLSERQVTIPLEVDIKIYKERLEYNIGSDGNLHIVTTAFKESSDMLAPEKIIGVTYSVVDLKSGDIKSYPVKFQNENMVSFQYLQDEKSVKLFGLFTDIAKDKDNKNIDGIYYALLDSKTMKLMKGVTFTYFTSEQQQTLFAKDTAIKEFKGVLMQDEKSKYTQEITSKEFSIEKALPDDDNNVVLFCSIMHNYSIMIYDGNTKTNTKSYRCFKRNVSTIKINNDGKIDWASTVVRYMDYPGSFFDDLNVIRKDNNFYVIYGSDPGEPYFTNSGKEIKAKQKEYANKIEYSVFDNKTGKGEKKYCLINEANSTDKKDFDMYSLKVIDNEFYTKSPRYGYKGKIFIGKFVVDK